MSQSDRKVVQYLSEAHASEVGLVSVLQSQIAMAPRGSYRDGLEKHLDETRTHARRIQERLGELGGGRSPFEVVVAFTETVTAQMLALSKTPFDLLRGSGGEEKVLKNAKDACATEQLEIATYTALERLAITVGDEQTAKLAASIRGDEERMLTRVMSEIPRLTDAVIAAEIEGHPSSETGKTAAADAPHKGARQPKATTRKAPAPTKKATRQSGRDLGDARAARRRNRSGPSAESLPIQRYPSLSTDEVVSKLAGLPETELRKVDAYEQRNKNRPAIMRRIRVLRGEEPWPGYDDLTISEIEAELNEGDYRRAQDVLVYERARRNRPELIRSALIPARFVLSTSSG